jgi:5-methylcytosine-specific restriction endonuclease McrA
MRFWQLRVRMPVLTRDGFQCVKCGGTDTLQVHHKTYRHLFFEDAHLGDLETLCKVCHDRQHKGQKKRPFWRF